MSKLQCMNPNSYYNKSLIETMGEVLAHHIVVLNNGHDVSKAPNGRESLLFREIGDNLGYENAVAVKAQFYSSDFRKQYGDWVKKGQKKPDPIEGVSELFDSNPELANQVYSALGFGTEKVSKFPILNKQLAINALKERVKEFEKELLLAFEGKGKRSEFWINEDIRTWEKIIKTLEDNDNVNVTNVFNNQNVGKDLSDKKGVEVFELGTDNVLKVGVFFEKTVDVINAGKKVNSPRIHPFTEFHWYKNEFAAVATKAKGVPLKRGEKLTLTDIEKKNLYSDLAQIENAGLTIDISKHNNFYYNKGEGIHFIDLGAETITANERNNNFFLDNFFENTSSEEYRKFKESFKPITQITPQQKQQAQQLYAQYLGSIFPNSLVNDIVYHGTTNNFDKFERGHRNAKGLKSRSEGFHFIASVAKSFYKDKYGNLKSVILNITNPLKDENVNTNTQWMEYPNMSDINKTKQRGYDSLIKFSDDKDGEFEYVMFDPEQIHILGTKTDIEAFKQFLKPVEIKIELDENGEPVFTEVLSALQKSFLQKKQNSYLNTIPTESVPAATSKLHETRKSLTPILDNLANKLNIPWVETTIESGHPSYYKDGKVYIDFNNITPDAPFHEYAHPLIQYLQISFPKEFQRLVEEAMLDKELVGRVKARYGTHDMTTFTNELVVTAIGENAVKARATVEAKGLLAAIKEFIDQALSLLQNIIRPTRKVSINTISKMNLRELGFMMGVTPPNFHHEYLQDVFYNLQKQGFNVHEKAGFFDLKVSDTSVARGYMDMFGWNNVEYIKGGYMAESEADISDVVIRIHNPLSTKGKALYRKEANADKMNKTGNEFFDDVIKSLNELANAKDNELKAKLSKQGRSKLGVEKGYIKKLINDIYSLRTLDPMLQVMSREVTKMRRKLDNDQSLEDISSSIKLLRTFGTIDKYYGADNVSPEVYENLKQIRADVGRLGALYIKKYSEQFKQEYVNMGGHQQLSDSIMESIRDIDGMSLQMIGSSFGQNAIEQVSDHIIRLNAYRMNKELEAFKSKVGEFKKEFENDFSFMIDGDNLLTKTMPEQIERINAIKSAIFETEKLVKDKRIALRELTKEHVQAQAESNYRKVFEIDAKMKIINNEIRDIQSNGRTWDDYHRFMQESYEYVLDEEKVADLEADMENLKELYYTEDAQGNPVLDQKGYEKAMKRYNPEIFMAYLRGEVKYPNEGWRYFNLVPKVGSKAAELNPKYLSLNEKQREFYDFFIEKFMDATVSLYDSSVTEDMSHDQAIRSFMSMPKDEAEKMKWYDGVKGWLGDLVAYQEGPEELDLHGVFTGVNRKDIKFKPAFEFMDKNKTLAQQKFAEVFTKYFQAGMSYKYKKDVENLLQTAKELGAYVEKINPGRDGNDRTDIFGDQDTLNTSSLMSKRLSHLIEGYLYHDTYEDMFGNIKIGEHKIGGERIIDLINDFTRYRQLGFNPFSGIGNLAMGTINNWTYSRRDEFFDSDNLRKGYYRLKNSMLRYVTINGFGTSNTSAKITAMAKEFGVKDNSHEVKPNGIIGKAFTFQESGEFINQMAVVLAVMDNIRTVEALVGKGNKIVDRTGTEREVFDLFTLDGTALVLNKEEFDFEALGITENKIFDMGQAIMKINKEIHGDYDPLNKMYLKRTALGRAMATFRTWLPQAIMQRVGKERSDYQLTAFYGEDVKRKGRYRSFGKALLEGKGKTALTLAGTFVTGFVPFVSGRVSKDLALPELDEANINQTLSEMRIMTTLMLSVAAMGKIVDDDDEFKEKGWFNFIYNMAGRMENELATFYYPSSSYKLFKQAVPAFDTMDQFGNLASAAYTRVMNPEKDIYKRGFRKGTSKLSKEFQNMLPFTKQIQSVWSTLNVQYANSAYRR